jgi:competence ComEA-like helix-hairpin-helix protein
MTLPVPSCSGSRSISWAILLVLVLALASPACVKRSRVAVSSNKLNEPATQTAQKEANDQQPASLQKANQLVNINTASANELETLPGIGKGLAERIIDHRQRFGPFRRTEHLIIVRGISDRRFRALRDLVTVKD